MQKIMVPGIKRKPFEERLELLELTTLLEKSIECKIIETSKIVTLKEDIYSAKFFKMRTEMGDSGYIIESYNSVKEITKKQGTYFFFAFSDLKKDRGSSIQKGWL